MGRAGRIPWNVPEDLAWFRHITMNRTIVMGTRTRASLPTAGLPGREIAVMTRRDDVDIEEGGTIIRNRENFGELMRRRDQVWISGGPECIKTIVGWSYVPDVVLWTQIGGDYQCDTLFPEIGGLVN